MVRTGRWSWGGILMMATVLACAPRALVTWEDGAGAPPLAGGGAGILPDGAPPDPGPALDAGGAGRLPDATLAGSSALASVDLGRGDLSLYAAPTQGGGPVVQIASGLHTPAIAFGDGVVFVDGADALTAVPTRGLEAATFGR